MTTSTLTLTIHEKPRTATTRHAANPKFAIVLMHPGGSNGSATLASGRWLEHEDISFCAPDAIGWDPEKPVHPYRNPTAWTTREPPILHRKLPDREFVEAVLDTFFADIPEGLPVYLVGHSNGVAIGFELLTESRHKDRFRGAAFYAGEWIGGPDELKVPVLLMAGQCDNLRPFNGAEKIQTPWFAISPPSAYTIVRRSIAAIGARGTPSDMTLEPHATVLQWLDGVAPLEFRVLHGQGHSWQAGQPAPMPEQLVAVFGPNNEHVDATQTTLDFFEKTRQK
jgi:poly(3-hydroxybutyrate) depolymerase